MCVRKTCMPHSTRGRTSAIRRWRTWRAWLNACPGARQEVAERIIALGNHTGANTVQVGFNRGAMPQEMFLEQIRRFARDVLPIVQAHQVTRVPTSP